MLDSRRGPRWGLRAVSPSDMSAVVFGPGRVQLFGGVDSPLQKQNKKNKNKKKHQALVTSTGTVGVGQAEPWPGWFHPHLSYHRQCLHVANVGQHGQRLAADLCVPREF